MYITLTSSQANESQSREMNVFLKAFLPRLSGQPGVQAIYHFNRIDKGDEFTIIIWENKEAAQAYRQSELIKEPIAFETSHNMKGTREGYELIFAYTG